MLPEQLHRPQMSIIVIVGESGSGKSTFIRRYFNQPSVEAYVTVGIDFGRLQVDDQAIEFWEIAGFEKNNSFKRISEPFLASHLQKIDLLFVVFSSSDPGSLSCSLKYIKWLQEHQCVVKEIQLVGNKSDLGIHPAYSATDCKFTNNKGILQEDEHLKE